MSVLSVAAALALASACQTVVAPAIIAGIAQHESGLDPTRVHLNADGSRDYGLMQINDRNFAWLGLTAQTALDPCRSIAAGATVLMNFSRYNSGSPTRSLPYAIAVTAKISALHRATSSPSPIQSAPEGEADLSDQPAEPTGEIVFRR